MGVLQKNTSGFCKPPCRIWTGEPSEANALCRSDRFNSLTSRSVFRRSTSGYVSWFRNSIPSESRKEVIKKTQNTHRQPIVPPINPPAIGPAIGPSIGPEAQNDVARPRFSIGNRSDITAAPRVRQREPPIPPSNRKTVKHAMFGESAQPICQTTKNQLAQLRAIRRPYISLKGAKESDPNYSR